MIFVVNSHIIREIKEIKPWFGTDITKSTHFQDFFNKFVSKNVDKKGPDYGDNNLRIIVFVGKIKNELTLPCKYMMSSPVFAFKSNIELSVSLPLFDLLRFYKSWKNKKNKILPSAHWFICR